MWKQWLSNLVSDDIVDKNMDISKECESNDCQI